jgi:hypothetical protein
VAWNKGLTKETNESVKKISGKNITNWGNADYRKNQTAKIAEAMNKPEIKEKVSKGLKKVMKEVANRPEIKKRNSEARIESWQDPVWREKQTKIIKETQNKPEVIEKQRKTGKIVQNKPEVKEKNRTRGIKMWQNPEFREKTVEKQTIAQNRPEVKLKRRINKIKRIEKNYGIVWPKYNKIACEFFKKFDEENNTKGRYAVYGGGEYKIEELVYWIDYINFDLKLIIEWDEKYHFKANGQLRERDIIRQQEIQKQFPDFEFRRIREDDI